MIVNLLLKKHAFILAVILCIFVCCIGTCSISRGDEKTGMLIKEVLSDYDGDYLIYINKKNFTLNLYNRELEVIASYKIGYGLNPDKKAKLYAGDQRTPEGIYKITEILSMDADKNSRSYKKLKAMNSVYFRAKDGHYKFGQKDADLGDNAYGPRFFRIDYPNKNDVRRYNEAVEKGIVPKNRNNRIVSVGSGIAIHGNNDRASIGELASSGCIRMLNEDIIELDSYIKIGLPVIISYE